jgi:hypothetical protein
MKTKPKPCRHTDKVLNGTGLEMWCYDCDSFFSRHLVTKPVFFAWLKVENENSTTINLKP